MALPIAPTPILTGKDAIALERYMRESKSKQEPLPPRNLDLKKIDLLIEERRKRREDMQS